MRPVVFDHHRAPLASARLHEHEPLLWDYYGDAYTVVIKAVAQDGFLFKNKLGLMVITDLAGEVLHCEWVSIPSFGRSPSMNYVQDWLRLIDNLADAFPTGPTGRPSSVQPKRWA